MTTRDERTTIIIPDSEENSSTAADDGLMVLSSIDDVRAALVSESNRDLDVARVSLDGSGGTAEFLRLLSGIGSLFQGDLLLIARDGGYLSSCGRGSDRILHQLSTDDVRFYVDVHGLGGDAPAEGSVEPARRLLSFERKSDVAALLM
jgi:hypothetical protein